MSPSLGALRLGLRRGLGMGARLVSCWTLSLLHRWVWARALWWVPCPVWGTDEAPCAQGRRRIQVRPGPPVWMWWPAVLGAHSQQPGRGSLLSSGGSGGYVYIAMGLFCRPRDDRSVCLGRGSPLPSLLFLRQVSILACYLPASLYLTLTTAWFGTVGAFTRPMTVCSQTGSSRGGGGVQQAWLFFP